MTLWSTSKSFDAGEPLGGCTVSLFDKNLKLRDGILNLIVWPGRKPDIGPDANTPGLVIGNENIELLNEANSKLELLVNK